MICNWDNLRLADNRQNQLNRSANPSSEIFKYKGVSIAYGKRKKKYIALFYKNGEKFFGGYHYTEEEAAKAYNQLCILHTDDKDKKFLKLNKE